MKRPCALSLACVAAVRSKVLVLCLGMETRGFWQLASVSDQELQRELAALLASGSRTEARIIAHLAELEERRLHLKAGSESLFVYCTKRLNLSDSEAFHRITAVRVARRFPVVFALLERRDIHLTAIRLLRDYLTPDNHAELLAEASHKTKWQVQELIARRFPRSDVESRIRKLPPPRARAENRGAPVVPADVPRLPAVAAEMGPVDAASSFGTSPVSSALGEPALPRPVRARMPSLPIRGLTEPTSASQYRIQLNASAALKEKLELLRALTSHSNPEGDLAAMIERAVDLALAQVQRERFAKTDRPRKSSARRVIRADGKTRKRAHVPHSTQREIANRDGLRCTYLGAGGLRCDARAFLQIHHEHPWARGGDENADNLRLLCASHNHLLAEGEFGVAHVAGQVAARREQLILRSDKP